MSFSRPTNETTGQAPKERPRCRRCADPADVIAEGVCLCADHYTQHVARWHMAADRAVWDEGAKIFRTATHEERAIQDKARGAYFRRAERDQEQAQKTVREIFSRIGMRPAQDYTGSLDA